MIQAEQLSFRRADAVPMRFPDFAMAAGEHWLIHGPSGCGKTTLLHLLCGLRLPSAGSLQVDGQNLAALAPAARDAWRGRRVGLVLQQPHLLPGLTVRQNLAAARYCAGLPQDAGHIAETLASLGVADLARRPVHALSQGQAQRVAVARAVVNAPALLLADEPTSSLDDDSAEAVYRLLRDSAERAGAALIVVTHDQRLRVRFSKQLALHATPEVAA